MYKKRSEFKKIAAIAVGACGIAYGFGGAEVQAAPPEGGNWTLLPAASDEFDGTYLYSQRKSRTITERLIRQERWNQNSMFRELQAM